LATGLLIVCTGAFTKNIQSFMRLEKEYVGSFTLGATTATYDLESEPANFLPIAHITEEVILQTTQLFTGSIMQMPPLHSAVKKDGKPAYLSARKGETIHLEPRPVVISEFMITKIALPKVEFKVVCSTGTYIRSLANDFGKALGCGAYLSSLCRTRIGNYSLKNAQSIEQLENEVAALRKLMQN
jgi:tRNA pseudouridine55 synthase